MYRFFITITMLLAFTFASTEMIPAWAEEDTAPAAPTAPATPPPPKKDAPEMTGKSKNNNDISGGKFEGDPVFVHMPPMILPIITDTGVEQIVTVLIDIEVKNFETADLIHSNMPRVQDTLMRALYGGLGQGSLRNGKLVDVAKIKAKATEALVDEVGIKGGAGADAIRNVLIEGVSQRML